MGANVFEKQSPVALAKASGPSGPLSPPGVAEDEHASAGDSITQVVVPVREPSTPRYKDELVLARLKAKG